MLDYFGAKNSNIFKIKVLLLSKLKVEQNSKKLEKNENGKFDKIENWEKKY